MESNASQLRNFSGLAPWLFLLSISLLVNYVDRGNLSLAAPLLIDELHITAWHLGILLSSFFWTYTALQFVIGGVVDRYSANLVIAAGYLVWSLATAFTGVVHSFAMLLAMRLMLGVGESVAFPSCSKILALHVPERYRGFANGLLMSGMKAGPAAGSLGAGLLIAKYGWRPIFIGIGLISLAWLPAWRRWMPRDEPAMSSVATPAPRPAEMFAQRSFWGACMGHFCGNYYLYVMVTWLPLYLVRERHLPLQSMAKVAGVFYLVDATSAIAAGSLTDFFVRHGHTPTLVRKSAMAIGHVTAATALILLVLAGPNTFMIWLIVAGVGLGIAGSGTYAFSQSLAGPNAAGIWTGFQNGFANFAGIIAPALTGFLVHRTDKFLAAFAITSALMLAGGFAWVFVIGRLEPVDWAQQLTPDISKATPSVQ